MSACKANSLVEITGQTRDLADIFCIFPRAYGRVRAKSKTAYCLNSNSLL